MSARSHHSTAGSDPASTFDHWLDDAVTGTPGFDASRNQESTGQLARAQAGARQLHGLAARTMVTPALMPARHRSQGVSDAQWSTCRARQRHRLAASPSPRATGPVVVAQLAVRRRDVDDRVDRLAGRRRILEPAVRALPA